MMDPCTHTHTHTTTHTHARSRARAHTNTYLHAIINTRLHTITGIDYDIPSGWLKEVPRKGNIAFYYCREQRVIEACFRYGSWNSGAGEKRGRV